ncbi:MAG: arginase family protein [Bdellovibrionales bacterium]|nr:arginase family protein [Bdellovibrionales bacterium]
MARAKKKPATRKGAARNDGGRGASKADLLLDELALYLRPPGRGIHAVSTGLGESQAFAARYLGATFNSERPWREHLAGLVSLKGPDAVAILALPHDTGAGIVRGASRGPEGIRARWGTAPAFELGDVFCVPQLLDDESASPAMLARARKALYADAPPALKKGLKTLPASPISIAERVYALLRALNPELRVLLLGGDHTVSWPAVAEVLGPSAGKGEGRADLGIVHFDAHTDLLPDRLGVRYCFATWAYHANELLGRGGRLVQIGIRASAKPREHWESTLGVRQLWAADCLKLTPSQLAEAVAEHLRARGVKRVYLTNDLDGTDSRWAAACGTPEPGGLTPDHVLAVIERLGAGDEFQILGADVVELAPGLSLDRDLAALSCETAARYGRASLTLLRKAGQRTVRG